MFVLVLAAEADETRQAITFLIVCLVGIAAMLTLLTAWYWRFTSPKRRVRSSAPTVADGATLIDASVPAVAPAPATVEIDRLPLGPATVDQPDRHRIEVPDRSADRPSVAARIEVVERCNSRSGGGREVAGVAGGRSAGPIVGPGRTRSRPTGRGTADPVPVAVGADSRHGNGGGDGQARSNGQADGASAVLSDEDWASVMRSAFDKMQR